MSWKDVASLLIVVAGFALFLYGSNYYNAILGWTGLSLIIVGIVVGAALEIYASMRKRGDS